MTKRDRDRKRGGQTKKKMKGGRKDVYMRLDRDSSLDNGKMLIIAVVVPSWCGTRHKLSIRAT